MNFKKFSIIIIAISFLFHSTSSTAYSHTSDIGGGITVTFEGIIQSAERLKDNVYIVYSVLSNKDTNISIAHKESPLFDSNGIKLNALPRAGVWIGEVLENPREIIANVPTKVYVVYKNAKTYKITSTYPRVTLKINGKEVTFRDVPAKP